MILAWFVLGFLSAMIAGDVVTDGKHDYQSYDYPFIFVLSLCGPVGLVVSLCFWLLKKLTR